MQRKWLLTLALVFVAAGMALNYATASAAWINKVDATVQEELAQGTTDAFVLFNQQADLSGAENQPNKEAKGQYVYSQLTAQATASQAEVRALLDDAGVSYRSFYIVNALYLPEIDTALAQQLAALSEVAGLYPNTPTTLSLPTVEPAPPIESPTTVEPSIALVKADQVWAQGYRGQGVVVGGADTGVLWTHEAVKDKYRGWDGTTANHNYNWHDAIPIPNGVCPGNSPEPCDDDQVLGGGHGTHTLGTMLGSDPDNENQIGMAPDAEWIACRNMNNGVGVPVTYLDCMEWFLAPTDSNDQNPDPTKSPHVINNSWGCVEACPYPLLQPTTEAIRAAGIVYVASAGNDGPLCSTILNPPAMYEASFTVGATSIDDTIADFSSRGPVVSDNSNRRKPDVTAPGVDIRSALRNGQYGVLSGTSMAGPHVAGLVALIISAAPDLAGEVDEIEFIMESTTVRLTTTEGCGGDGPTTVPNNTFGFGRIDALAAITLATSGPTAVSVGDVATASAGLPWLPLAFFGGLVALVTGIAVKRLRSRN